VERSQPVTPGPPLFPQDVFAPNDPSILSSPFASADPNSFLFAALPNDPSIFSSEFAGVEPNSFLFAGQPNGPWTFSDLFAGTPTADLDPFLFGARRF
jgi:hypothetical protein